MQHSKRVRQISQDATGIGFSINVHFIKKITPLITRNWSFGYQLNILFQTPNRGVTSYAYGLLSEPTISLDEYQAQFRNAGANQTVSLNYTYMRKKTTAVNLGFAFSGSQYKVARSFSRNFNGSVSFRSRPQSIFLWNIELQQRISKNFMLQANAIFAEQNQVAYGFGFRIFKTNLLKLLLINYPVLSESMIRVSVFFIAFFSLTSLYAQKYASVGAWDNVVLYLPVIQGLSSDCSIQMSLLSGKLESVGTPVLFGAPTNRNPQYEDLFNFDPKIPIQANIRNDYFISLQKSFLYDEGSRLSIGLHMHRYTRNKQKLWNDTHFGGTINYHFLINSKKKRSSFISIGYQLNITKRSPNYSVTSTVYNEWFNLTNVIPYQDYVNQFKRFDWHHILGLNYALLVKKRLALNFGSSFELFSQPKYYTASADIRLLCMNSKVGLG